jgi:hypothetical protein
LPATPEVLTLQGAELALYVAGNKKGQAEGMREAASALVQLLTSLKLQGVPQEQIETLEPVLKSASTQMAQQCVRLEVEHNRALGLYIIRSRAKPTKLLRKLWSRLSGA